VFEAILATPNMLSIYLLKNHISPNYTIEEVDKANQSKSRVREKVKDANAR
jgi:hypothetical protein